MARTTPSPRAFASGPTEPSPHPFLLIAHAVTGLVVCLGMGAVIFRHLADLGSETPALLDLLALDTGTGAGSVQAAAADSWSQLLRFVALVCATGSCAALVAGAGVALVSRQYREAAHRVITIGLWLALAVCLAAMIPLQGSPFALGFTIAGPSNAEGIAAGWHPASQALAVAAGAGLLVSSIPRAQSRPLSRGDVG